LPRKRDIDSIKLMFSLIVAHDQNRGIGIKNVLPWSLSKDMRYFKQITLGNTVIMGRRTWESIPEKFRPLPQRKNVVLTRNTTYNVPSSVIIATSLEDAIQNQHATGDIFIIGGSMIYKEAIQHIDCTRLYVTEIQSCFNCDAFFPDYNGVFTCIDSSDDVEENGIRFVFKVYERTRN